MQKENRFAAGIALLGVVDPWTGRESNRRESQSGMTRLPLHFHSILLREVDSFWQTISLRNRS